MSSQAALNGTPAQPVYVLRGHTVPIHSLAFTRNNLQLLSGDADGFVVIWSLITKRPTAVWQAHPGPILGLECWGDDKIITHGRNDSLCVWRVTSDDEENGLLSTELPAEHPKAMRHAPWILHRLKISTLTFCSFACCTVDGSEANTSWSTRSSSENATPQTLLIAVCGAKDSEVEIYHLPAEKQIAFVPEPDQNRGKTGMVMALQLCSKVETKTLLLMVGYESGRTCAFKQTAGKGTGWQEIYSAQPHSQPILSLCMAPSQQCFFTSSADAVIARHPLSSASSDHTQQMQISTRHAGQQGLKIRSDGKILATAGWDARVRVYSVKTLKEVAVLKWHKEGCYIVALATILNRMSSDVPQDQLTQTTSKTFAQSRQERARTTHWLAAGAKDGKISLWDIY